MAKVQRPSQFKMITFWRRRHTLKGSLGQTGIETQTMVERLSSYFQKKNQSLTRSWPLNWRGCFGQGVEWDAPLGLDFGLAFGGFTIWPSKLRGRGSSWPKIWTLDLAFGGFTLCTAEGSTYYDLLAFFSPFIWTPNKVWPLNSTASWLRWP